MISNIPFQRIHRTTKQALPNTKGRTKSNSHVKAEKAAALGALGILQAFHWNDKPDEENTSSKGKEE